MHVPDRAELLDRYRAWMLEQRHLSTRTWRDTRRILEAFWDHAGKEPNRCTARDLHRFLHRRAAPGGNSRGVRLAATTQRNYASKITAAYHRAYARGWLRADPMRDVALPQARLGPPRALELADVARLLGHVARDPRQLLLVWLAYGAGLRCVEIARLRREAIRLGHRPQILVTGKANHSRVVPLNQRVAGVLRGQLTGLPAVGPVVVSLRQPGHPVTARTVSKLLSVALHGAGVAASGHQLRHTFATELLAAGKGRNFRAVQHLLGHRSPLSTERYVAAYDQDAWDAVVLLPDPRHPHLGPDRVHVLDPAGAARARPRRHLVTCTTRPRRRGPRSARR